jgi:hypothetical protein
MQICRYVILTMGIWLPSLSLRKGMWPACFGAAPEASGVNEDGMEFILSGRILARRGILEKWWKAEREAYIVLYFWTAAGNTAAIRDAAAGRRAKDLKLK